MPWETDHVLLCDLFTVLEGYEQRKNEQRRNTRIIAYVIAASSRDPKKPFPSLERFMPLLGDEEALTERTKRRKAEANATKEKYKKLGIL